MGNTYSLRAALEALKKIFKGDTKKIIHKVEQLQKDDLKVQVLPIATLSPSKNEIDAFRIKAFTLLKDHEINFSSLLEQLKVIREIPIHIIEEKPTFSKTLEESIVALHQTISMLPGETIKVKGSFKRFTQSQNSIPIPESFQIDSHSIQTGFPHPSQHHGWALPSELITEDHPLHAQMKNLATDLMPNGKYNKKAKELLKLKTAVFNKHAREFIELHRRLNSAIGNDLEEEFYQSLQINLNPYAVISNAKISIKLSESDKIQAAEIQLEQFIFELENGEMNEAWMYKRLKALLINDIEFWDKASMSLM